MGTKDIYLEIFLEISCYFLELLFLYYSLPTTADTQKYHWNNICRLIVLHIIVVVFIFFIVVGFILEKVITAKIAFGPDAGKHYSFPCK